MEEEHHESFQNTYGTQRPESGSGIKMRELDVVGQAVGGQVGQIKIREKQDRQIE